MNIQFTSKADNDIHSIYEYLALETGNPLYAQKILKLIEHSIDHLRQHPYMGRISRVEGSRELIISGTPYLVVYRLLNDEYLEVVAIIHSRRKLTARFH